MEPLFCVSRGKIGEGDTEKTDYRNRARILLITGVGRIRARYLTARLPNPPVRPVRETFASYGSRERDIMGGVHFASSTVHSPWTALRVRWVPLYCFPTLSLRAFAMCAVFPHSDYYALFDCLQGLGAFGAGLPCLLPTLLNIPCRLSRVQRVGLKRNAVGGVFLVAPSTLCGSPVLTQGKFRLTCVTFCIAHMISMHWSVLLPYGCSFRFHWLTF